MNLGDLLKYNGLDSLYEILLAKKQIKALKNLKRGGLLCE
jgi:hypothetical protein